MASSASPYYTYDEDGTNRRENVTDWALDRFRTHYYDNAITKWDIFHYVYGLLHHPAYRERYQANLKRELPRIPFAPEFRPFADAGARLARIHVHYEDQPEHPLKQIETPDMPLDWRVEKMRLSKDKDAAPLQRLPHPRRHPPRSLQLPPRQPLRPRMDHRPVPRQDRQTLRHPQRPQPPRRSPVHPPAHRPGHRRQPRNRPRRPQPSRPRHRNPGRNSRRRLIAPSPPPHCPLPAPRAPNTLP